MSSLNLNHNNKTPIEGEENSFSVRYVDTRGRTCAALFANRPTEAAELRRAFTEDALALAA